MTSNHSFMRKVAYIVAIALLLVPLSIMSRPATVRRDALGRFDYQPGGTLAEMRKVEGLSQAQLGEIDPASETMKLATFGMRGVAVALLWNQANEAKKKENWDNLSTSLEQIARLQPNFVPVWEFQSHNLAYNVSVEFDDYRQRYHWVKKGIDHLIDGTNYNRDNPRLLWYAGWIVGQKIGRSDEKVQFRKMFRDDTEFHALLNRQQIDVESAKGADGKPDNWLVGRLWYLKAQDSVDLLGKPLGGKSPALFHSSPIMSRINFFSDLEKDPNFDEERARAEARQAGKEWEALGDRPLDTSNGYTIQMNAVDRMEVEIKDLKSRLDELVPGVREELRASKLASLPSDVRSAIETPTEERTSDQQIKAQPAEFEMQINPVEIALKASPQKSIEARRTAQRILSLEDQLRLTRSSRQVVNYDFWRDRCASGADEQNSLSRRHLFQAKQAYARTDLKEAKEKYEQSFKEWADIFKRWPLMLGDAENDDLIVDIENYIKVLDQLDLRDAAGGILPADFPLVQLLKDHQKDDLLRFRDDDAKPPENKSDDEKSENPKATDNDAKPEAADEPEASRDEPKPSGDKPATANEPADDKPESAKPEDAGAEKPQADSEQPATISDDAEAETKPK